MLTIEQEKALSILQERIKNKEQVSILQGVAGSGKSYLLKSLLYSLNVGSAQVAFVTYTGVAAQVLQRNNLPATTIHSLIYKPIMSRGVCIGFKKKSIEDLPPLKIIVVDEFSMVSQEILNDLLAYQIPLILVGDYFQLPPIGEPNIYINRADAVLSEVHRQALDNPILAAATRIREGGGLPFGTYGATLWVGSKKEADQAWFRKDVQIITGLNQTKDNINRQISPLGVPGPGEKIMFLKNDWKHGITNGTIVEIKRARKLVGNRYLLTFNFNDKKYNDYLATFDLGLGAKNQSLNQRFTFAYAISCHKSQGQTFDCPGIIIDESTSFRENKSKWLYTAITRFTGNYNVAILR